MIPMLYQKPHVHKRRFYNHSEDRSGSFFFKTMGMMLQSFFVRNQSIDDIAHLWSHPLVQQEQGCTITWIGHASFMIELDGFVIVTDPVFGSLGPFFGRISEPGFLPHHFNNVDVILLSHNHRDHMDTKSLYGLKPFLPRILVPLGVKTWFDKRKFCTTAEFNWWQQEEMIMPNGKKIRFTFLPAHHWSQRGLFDKNRTLWGSWMIEYDEITLYFAGDSAYASHFHAIANSWKSIDMALMPIAPCEPRHWLKQSHLDAHEAVQAFCDLGAHHFIPMHWGTFRFGIDHIALPIERLYAAWKDIIGIEHKKLSVLKPGQTIALKEDAVADLKNSSYLNTLFPNRQESLQ